MTKTMLLGLGFVILLGTVMAVLALNNRRSTDNALAAVDLADKTLSELRVNANQAASLAQAIPQLQSRIATALSAPTPTPSVNAITGKFVASVRQADTKRQEQLGGIQEAITNVRQQLTDLQQRQTALDVRIQGDIQSIRQTVKSQEKSGLSTDALVVAIGGALSSLATFLLAWRKDQRETEELKLKLDEYKLKLSEATLKLSEPRYN
jgi:hypothetical protein